MNVLPHYTNTTHCYFLLGCVNVFNCMPSCHISSKTQLKKLYDLQFLIINIYFSVATNCKTVSWRLAKPGFYFLPRSSIQHKNKHSISIIRSFLFLVKFKLKNAEMPLSCLCCISDFFNMLHTVTSCRARSHLIFILLSSFSFFLVFYWSIVDLLQSPFSNLLR